MNIKKCTKCGNEYPATTDYFHKQKGGYLGIRNKCKKCVCYENKEYRKSPTAKEKHRIAMAIWRKNNHEKAIEISSKNYKKYAKEKNEIRREKYRNDSEYRQKCYEREKKYKESGRRYEVSATPEQREKARMRSKKRRTIKEKKEHDYKRNSQWRKNNKNYLIELHKKRRVKLEPSYIASSLRVKVNDLPNEVYEIKKTIIELKRELKKNNIKIR